MCGCLLLSAVRRDAGYRSVRGRGAAERAEGLCCPGRGAAVVGGPQRTARMRRPARGSAGSGVVALLERLQARPRLVGAVHGHHWSLGVDRGVHSCRLVGRVALLGGVRQPRGRASAPTRTAPHRRPLAAPRRTPGACCGCHRTTTPVPAGVSDISGSSSRACCDPDLNPLQRPVGTSVQRGPLHARSPTTRPSGPSVRWAGCGALRDDAAVPQQRHRPGVSRDERS